MYRLLFIGLLSAAAARAQLIVSDPPLTSLAGQQLGRLVQLNAQLTQANQVLSQMWISEGDAKAAVARIEEMSSYVTNVGKMGAPKYRADTLAEAVRMPEAMNKSQNPYRTVLGRNVQVYGQRYGRDPALYEANLRREGAVSGVRDLLEINRQHQHAILGYLSTANQRLETSRTWTQLVAAQAEIERLRTLMIGAGSVGQNAVNDLQLKEAEWLIARQDEAVRVRESQALRARLAKEYAQQKRKRWETETRRNNGDGRSRPWPQAKP